MSNVYAVVMAGGAGTRFWPASRYGRPKQLLPLAATDEPLLTATVRRLDPVIRSDRVLIVTGAHLAESTERAVSGVAREHILCEPAPRNTAPCIAWATSRIARTDPEALVAVLPSDHFIGDEAQFRAVLERALHSASRGNVTTIGIVPTRPETGYGYIELGDELAEETYSVVRFVEKPDRQTAEAFVAGKRHLWNAGMFFFRAKDMLALVEEHLPELASGIAKLDRAAETGTEDEALRAIFPSLPSVSVDHGIMEKARGLAVVPGEFGWNDLGSWESAWELGDHDQAGNSLSAGAIAIDAENNLVRSLGKLPKVVALVGVEDLVVVDTDDALLVMSRDRAQDVRLVVEALRASGQNDRL